MNRLSFLNRNRLSWWLPRVPLDIAVPETRVVTYTGNENLVCLLDGKIPDGFDDLCDRLVEIGHEFGWPIFLRTDYLSGKHGWKDTCCVSRPKDIGGHIEQLVDHSLMADMETFPTDLWVVRKMIPTSPAFTAFPGEMPIVKERRYFVQDSKVICHHPYWPENAFNDRRVNCDDWRERLSEINKETHAEIRTLSQLSSKVGAAIGGAWSIDWLWSEDESRWYLIDMAEAESSYHCPECKFSKGEM